MTALRQLWQIVGEILVIGLVIYVVAGVLCLLFNPPDVQIFTGTP